MGHVVDQIETAVDLAKDTLQGAALVQGGRGAVYQEVGVQTRWGQDDSDQDVKVGQNL